MGKIGSVMSNSHWADGKTKSLEGYSLISHVTGETTPASHMSRFGLAQSKNGVFVMETGKLCHGHVGVPVRASTEKTPGR
jgi:hypothetical protein